MPVLAFLLGILAQTAPAGPDLVPISRNSVVFVESTTPGSEWEAFRLADTEHAAVWKATGPGKLLLKVRTYVETGPAVAAVLLSERIVLTARVEPELDPEAKIPGEPRQISKAHYYLVKVPAGPQRVTVRYSEGSMLLVSAALSPMSPLELVAAEEGEVPIVTPQPTTRVQRLDPPPEPKPEVAPTAEPELVTPGPAPTAESAPVVAPRITPPPSRRGPQEEEAVIPSRSQRTPASPIRPLTVPAPYLMLELRGGLRVSDLDAAPTPAVGLSVRLPLPRLDPRLFSLGLSADLSTGFGDQEVRGVVGGPTIDVVELAQTSVVLGVDLRYAFWTVPDVFEAYGGGGLAGLFGNISISNERLAREALSLGALAQLRFGATLGTGGGRPFVELAAQFGRYGSDLVEGDGAYGAFSLLLGYRVELITEVEVE